MNTTQTYHNETTFTNQSGHSFRGVLALFLRKHTLVFQSLTRGGTPHGGTIRPYQAHSVVPKLVETNLHQQVMQLQQQVKDLSQTISQLGDQVNGQTSAQRVNSAAPIGINRFRSLRAGSY